MKRIGKLRLSLVQDAPSGLEPEVIDDAQLPVTKWVTVTPDLARQWLAETNTNNRPVRESYVIRLSGDMRTGKWRGLNGEFIGFDWNGRLVEGQHRLLACVESDRPFQTLLITNLDPAVYSTIGIGATKTFGDFLGPVHGEKNVHLLAAGVRLVYMWKRGTLNRPKDGEALPTIPDLKQVFEEHPNLRDSANYAASRAETRKLLTSSYIVLLHYAATTQNLKTEMERFLDRLTDGLCLEKDDPVHHLRKFLLSQRSTGPGHRRAGQIFVLALAIKAWNAFKENKNMTSLKLAANEDFPTL